MREPILKAVAMPMKVFWAPMSPAVANFIIQMVIWILIFFQNLSALKKAFKKSMPV